MSPQRWLVVAVAALVLVAYGLSATEDRWETALIDAASQRGPLPEDEWVSVIGVDRAALDKLGRWPLPRDVYATLIDRLAAARAKTVVLAVPLSDVQSDPGLAVLRRMKGLLAAAASGAPLGPVERRLSDLVEQSEDLLDVDAQLVRSLGRAGNVLLVAGYRAATPADPPMAPLPPHLRKSAVPVSGAPWPTVADGVLPAAPFGSSALGTGHAAVFPDRDGVVRREALWINHGGQALPSVAWLAALRAQGLDAPAPSWRPGSPLVLGGREVVPDQAGQIRPRVVRHASGASVRVDSLQDVLGGKVPAERWVGRTVFVGLTATGLDPALAPTLDRPGAVDVVRLAQVSASLLTGQVVYRPLWAGYLGWILVVLAVMATVFMPAGQAAGRRWWLAVGGLAITLLLLDYLLLSFFGVWLPTVLAVVLLLAGFLALQAWEWLPAHVRIRFRGSLETSGPDAGPGAGPPRRSSTAGRERQMAGRKLGPYRIGRLIGKGGKASVYRAIDSRSQTQVALKLLDLPARYAGADWQGARDRFLHEARAAGHLRHPNIVQILDSGVQDGMAYIAMEYLGGQDLGAWCRPGHLLPLTLTLSIAARIGQALAFAHRQQVVHRDVKPANILYDRDSDTLKVTDFGIAHLGGSRSSAGDAARTPGYMSPEQCAGAAVDLRSDLYSLGVTLYQMLTGVLPLAGESLAELERRIATENAPDIRTLNPSLPQPLAELVARLLDKQPDRRYQDGDDVAQDLYRLAAELGQQAAQDPFSDSGFGFAPTQIEAPDGAVSTPVRGGSAGAGVRSGAKPGKSP